MVVTAVSDVEQARMRQLDEMRREKKPSSGQEGGFQGGRNEPIVNENENIYRKNIAAHGLASSGEHEFDSGLEQTKTGHETAYRHGLGNISRNVKHEHGVDQDERSAEAGLDNRDISNISNKEIEHGKGLARVRRALEHIDPEKSKKLKEIEDKYEASVKTAKEAKVLIASVTPWGFWRLIKEIDLLVDWAYIAAIIAAAFDDLLLDGSTLGQIPVLGAVLSWCCIIFVIMMHILANFVEHDRSIAQKWAIRQATKWGFRIFGYIASFVIETIPAVGFLPSEMAVAIAVYLFALAERVNKSAEEKELNSAMA